MIYRTLTSKDIFPICGILRKIGVKELRSAFSNADGINPKDKKIDLTAIGMDIFFDITGTIVSNLPSCEREIYTFLSSVVRKDDGGEMSVDELKEMPMGDFAQVIMDVVSKQEFKDFFKVALKSKK